MMLKILWGIFSTVHLCSFVSVLGISHVSLLLSLQPLGNNQEHLPFSISS